MGKAITYEVEEMQRWQSPGSATPEARKKLTRENTKDPVYVVRKLTNTVDHSVGEVLEKEDVRELIARDNVKVVVFKPRNGRN